MGAGEAGTAAHAGRASASAGGARAAAFVRSGRDWEEAADAVAAEVAASGPFGLGLAFVDSRFAAHYGDVLARLREAGAGTLAGASGEAVIGPGVEAQAEPAVAFLGLSLPGLDAPDAAVVAMGPDAPPGPALDRVAEADASAWLIFADPRRVDGEALVRAVAARAPEATLLGGLASTHDPYGGGSAVFAGGEAFGGAVLVGLRGDFGVRPLVAQGAEPIGRPWTVTACEGNMVREIGSRPPLDVLRETLDGLDEATRERAERNLLVGLAMDEYRPRHERGDFLIRNVTGGDRESGAIAINAIPRVGQTFRFQFRDASAAGEDLRRRLDGFREGLADGERVVGAVLCSCNGRGAALFGEPHHDARALAAALGPVPSAGMFCSGEIGPVGGEPFVHGFTASIALLTVREAPPAPGEARPAAP